MGPQDLLVTIDVQALYTNIPHTESIQALNRILEEAHTDPMKKLLICRFDNLVSTKNYFTFNNILSRQIQGTAMGTKMAPSYANIFVKHIEIQLVDTSPKNLKISFRFIDDIIMIWGHGRNELENVIHLANNLHPNIIFFTINNQEIPFLDTVICRGMSNYIVTKLHDKPTDSKQYLHFNSVLPWKQKSVPYGLLIRCKRICSEEKYFEKEARIILHKLATRKYPTKLLQEALDKVSKMDRLQCLIQIPKRNQIRSD